MDKKIKQAYLYDFYGELLNEHQRKIYEDVVFNDMSLSEIAEEEGISRQGVSDMIHRIDKKLLAFEDKLHLIEKFLSIKEDVEIMHQEMKALSEAKEALSESQKQSLLHMERLSSKILEAL